MKNLEKRKFLRKKITIIINTYMYIFMEEYFDL